MALLDLKHTDADKFLQWTDGQLPLIQHNIEKPGKSGANILFRVPIITDFNDDEITLNAIIQQAATHHQRFGGSGEIHFRRTTPTACNKYHLPAGL